MSGEGKKREFEEKVGRVRNFLNGCGRDAALFCRNDSFAWLSCGGGAFVDKSSESAAASLLVTHNEAVALCNSSEMYRIPEEEIAGLPFEIASWRWNEDSSAAIGGRISGLRTISDSGAYGTEFSDGLVGLRHVLTDEELDRYEAIGPEAAEAVESRCLALARGDSEFAFAGAVTGALMERGFQVPVCLVASDDRLLRYRHPIPTAKRVERTAMIAVCAQKYGLIVSLTRMVSFGHVDSETRRRHDAVIKIDANYIMNTVPGARTGDIVLSGKSLYESEGFGEDFYLHHQGGALGYAARYYCASERDENVAGNGQAFSWNPTIAGVKSEDTYIIRNGSPRVISDSGKWPMRRTDVNGRVMERPDILVR
jgi:Xaa-Pro aminopeptidase